jgi:PleD family two-component response regulator
MRKGMLYLKKIERRLSITEKWGILKKGYKMAENRIGNCRLDKNIRILVAEEDVSFLRMVEDSLKASGSLYHIEKASSGKECLRMLQKERFDILLLDHSLSDGEGLNWLRQFNESGIGIPHYFCDDQGRSRVGDRGDEGRGL